MNKPMFGSFTRTSLETSTEYTGTSPCAFSNTCIDQNFLLIWLDANIDEVNDNDCRNTIAHLQTVINPIHTFTDADRCIDFLTDVSNKNVFLIISGTYGPTIVPVVHEMSEISSIYILCENQSGHKQWTKEWSRIEGVFTNISPICEALKQAVNDASFINTQRLLDVLFTNEIAKQYVDHDYKLNMMDRLKRHCHHYLPRRWSFFDCFLDSKHYRSFHLMEIGTLIKMDFFVWVLHQPHSFISDQYQDLFMTKSNQWMKTKGGLMPLNNFLSTSNTRYGRLIFAHHSLLECDLLGILFTTVIDPSISCNWSDIISDISHYHDSKTDILFSTHSIIHFGQIKQIDGATRLWQVNLTLTSDKNLHINTFIEQRRKEGYQSCTSHTISSTFHKMEEFCNIFGPTPYYVNPLSLNYILWICKNRLRDYAKIILCPKNLLQILCTTKFSTYSKLVFACCYKDLIYEESDNFSKALSFFDHAVDTKQYSSFKSCFCLIFHKYFANYKGMNKVWLIELKAQIFDKTMSNTCIEP